MKKNCLLMAALLTVILIFNAGLAFGQDDVKTHSACKYCGMDREKFGHSRMLIEYSDGTTVGVCSLHCASVDIALNIDKTVKVISVADFNKGFLLDAEKAYWVIGGNKSGVMTRRAKWAFEKKVEADRFVAENGGNAANFETAIMAAYEDMYQDMKMIREKRKIMKRFNSGL